MKILVTGSKGFIGKNLVAELRNRNYTDIFEYGRETDPSLLDEYCKEADFIFHLAGVNRPKDQSEYMDGNYGLTSVLLETLKKHHNTCPVMISSSVQANLENPYGISKKAGEDLLFRYSKETDAKVLVYRFPNVFGKWCRPNYNSAIATFCYNVARDLPISVNDPGVVMNLLYIDDVVEEMISALNGNENTKGDFCEVPIVHTTTLGEIVDLIYSFKMSREERSIPDMSDVFTKKLYSTYLSYLPETQFSYDLKMNIDDRGSFTEFIKTNDRGQVSVNISKPGITKGNHWHHTKNEKFLVVNGKGVIRFRNINTNEIIEYFVSGDKMEVVDIPTGYTHNIENLGDTNMVTIMWANELFDPEKPDTYFLEV
ncbi:capsular polysaccharide biosynthesis protein CapF [Chengkuizengella axinellae]|uniref:Capsular polysaccharide biosynthesis protein CapF n=1 Tax=Chengkuizengella axinellae TaxID=3064388 RepID=A0ABT9IZF0_9BACL|nr:capsular polysaccharide biosynthesis protein CapF [Chengkuizengella sp. 2205SS18-9]MDP5274732.1 capsular polysaccharide biosynthesis protein CapF [Chengkuizengella sp. 2205SS18-9]